MSRKRNKRFRTDRDDQDRMPTPPPIRSEDIPPPSWVGNLGPSEATYPRFLKIVALDGFVVEAVLKEPDEHEDDYPVLVISVHGSGGNYASSAPGILVRSLPCHGYAVLGINTRQGK